MFLMGSICYKVVLYLLASEGYHLSKHLKDIRHFNQMTNGPVNAHLTIGQV